MSGDSYRRSEPDEVLWGYRKRSELVARIRELEARNEELELRDKMRDDGEHHLLAEIEARDAEIKRLRDDLEMCNQAYRSLAEPGIR